MADLLKATLRGHILSSPWAINLWYQKASPPLIGSESTQAYALASSINDYYVAHIAVMLSSNCVLEKVIAEGYNTPACFYELATASIGAVSGSDANTFVAMGFRQYRTNSDFKASTHRLPGVLKANIEEGSWAYTGSIDVPTVSAVTAFFRTQMTKTVDVVNFAFDPVLIRTRHTPRGSGVTTFFDPPQTNVVEASAFYGLTSQVSRKSIISA